MARSKPRPGHLFLLLFLLAAFLFVRNRLQGPEPHRRSVRHRAERGFAPYDYGSPEPRRESRRERRAETPAECEAFGATCSSRYFSPWRQPEGRTCRARLRNGYPVPDPRCTPGGVNPSLSADLLRNPRWSTRCVRNCQSSEAEKHVTYGWYGIRTPRGNEGAGQVCELDHLVPLELGGADGLGNIWPQCGPSSAALDNRYFKMKDRVENYLADQVKAGRISLDAAQRGIAADWTQYLPAATVYCASGGRC